MARLLCMYGATYPAEATLDPRVKAALERYAPQHGLEVEWINTHDDFQTYADELEKRWLGTEPVIIVEQDKEVFADTLGSLLACGEPWCGYTFWQDPVPHTHLVLGGFGVTKFSPWVQRSIPVSAFRGQTQVGIDRRFYDCLISNFGYGCHLHGHVVHHHVYEPRPERIRRHVAQLREQRVIAPAIYPEPADPGLLPGSYRLAG
jgi:hypothetical protein